MAGARFSVKVEMSRLQAALRQAERAQYRMRDIWNVIGLDLVRSVQANFDAEGGRQAAPKWKPLAPSTLKQRIEEKTQGKILTRHSHLRNSVNHRPSSHDVLVGTNLPYAAAHQFGADIPATTIRPRLKKALFWPGAAHPVKSVTTKGHHLDARPFLLIQPSDWSNMATTVEKAIVPAELRR